MKTIDDPRFNNRDELLLALQDPRPDNRIATAVRAAAESYIAGLARQVERRSTPTAMVFVLAPPCTPFEEIVVQLSLESVSAALGRQPAVHWWPSFVERP